eukprot:CAMPEP_0117501818 /NCGR_PEP_ID=MMETSP0784-20121206/23496_1 /TAXON_ID=39447 /ORGANISM="" /LENGTH=193 /DNA_ID=CAMNT_0005297087 /DNA_START=98 /DNA_END=680 /DNA_ORIENTATION=+
MSKSSPCAGCRCGGHAPRAAAAAAGAGAGAGCVCLGFGASPKLNMSSGGAAGRCATDAATGAAANPCAAADLLGTADAGVVPAFGPFTVADPGTALVQLTRNTFAKIFSSNIGTVDSSLVTSIQTVADSHFILNGSGKFRARGSEPEGPEAARPCPSLARERRWDAQSRRDHRGSNNRPEPAAGPSRSLQPTH